MRHNVLMIESANHNNRGFTLVELSIVLVIIGLIIGSIFVGRDLIHTSEIRSTISQIEKFNTAVNTFKGKYGYIPGDIPVSTANQFGLFAMTGCAGSSGCGDGDGLIESTGGLAWPTGGEPLVFWRHLSEAGLISGSFGISGNSALDTNGMASGNVTPVTMSQTLPPAKLGNGLFFAILAQDELNGGVYNYNYFFLEAMGSISPPTGYNTLGAGGVTSLDAFIIDTKIDDGSPNTGKVVGLQGNGGNFDDASTWNLFPTAGVCQVGSPHVYNFITDPNGRDCGLRFKLQ
jgi:prepilin-type N-terminal cleavage/methylation domain-containing protein